MIDDKRNKVIVLSLAAIVGFLSIRLPDPYSNIGMALLILSFIVLIVIGHKVAFRTHKWGMFAQYAHPEKILGAKLSKGEKYLLLISIVIAISILASFFLDIIMLNYETL